jgi:glutamyl-tRNA synthetase
MILRIEDTDQSRYVEGAEEYISEALSWVGITADESPENGGPFGPYRQSERNHIYGKYAQKLLEEGNAYYAFDTPEELEAMRDRLKASKVDSPQYNSITRMQMENSLTLSESEVKERLVGGEPYVIRLKVPRKEEIRLNDLVRGWVMVHSSAVDDKVLMKSDGMPTYHLANVVDDHLMKITHVIRGEEWLPSAPLHVLLYRFLGWEDTMPQFAHLPLLLKPDGNGKLSKRDGDKHGFPVFPIEGHFPGKEGMPERFDGFREAGYLPEALINFLAFLGWNPGTSQEIFSMEELIKAFSIDRIGKSGTKFDIEKAKWYNQQYLKSKDSRDLVHFLIEDTQKAGINTDHLDLIKICDALKERITFPHEILQDGMFFFREPEVYDENVTSKKWNSTAIDVLTEYARRIEAGEQLTASSAKSLLDNILTEKGVKVGQVMQALRLAITGMGAGPDLMLVLEILGKERVASRIRIAVKKLPVSIH